MGFLTVLTPHSPIDLSTPPSYRGFKAVAMGLLIYIQKINILSDLVRIGED